MTQEPGLFDRRTLNRFRKEGVVTEDQIKDHLKKLPDSADKAETLGSEPVPSAGKGKGR